MQEISQMAAPNPEGYLRSHGRALARCRAYFQGQDFTDVRSCAVA